MNISTAAVAASAVVTAVMAFFTARMARKTSDLANSAKQEAEAVVAQGESIKAEADAVVAQGESIKLQAEATAKQAEAVTDQAKAAAVQVELTRQALQAAIQPWLTIGLPKPIPTPFGTSMDEPPLFLTHFQGGTLKASIAVRNVGSGLAIIDARSSYLVGWEKPQVKDERKTFTWATVANPVLPPGDTVRINFSVTLANAFTDFDTITHRTSGYGELALDVVYGDAMGQQKTRLRFCLAATETGDWVAFSLDYYTPPDAATPHLQVRVD